MTKNEKIAIALLKKAMELRRAGLLCLIALSMGACAGFGVKMEGYRIDEIQHSQRTYKQPLKCLFTSCESLETENTGEK